MDHAEVIAVPIVGPYRRHVMVRTSPPSGAPNHWPYLEHRTCAEVFGLHDAMHNKSTSEGNPDER